jgi:hypothetical protein
MGEPSADDLLAASCDVNGCEERAFQKPFDGDVRRQRRIKASD